ncbi:transmembrane protein 130 [Aplochiton taeniatus]
MFELFDPQNTLRTARFTYTWDLGNGDVIEGSEPFVRYNYSVSGNYTIRLHVDANVTKRAKPLTGVYSMDVKVLDAIKHIEMKGPTSYQLSENASLSFRVDGSPPMWVCWRVLPHCITDLQVGCRLAMLYGSTLSLNHTFTTTGVHCLDISARNDISKLQTSYSIYVQRNPHSNLFFIIPSAAVFIATFSFIIVFACRPRNAKSKISVSSNATYSNIEMRIPGDNEADPSEVSVTVPSTKQQESQPLLK